MPEPGESTTRMAGVAGRGVGLLILVVLTWKVLAQGLSFQGGDVLSFIHGIDLVFHEAGHVIFGFFGEFIAVAGGSLMQVLIPVITTVAFLRTRQWASAAVTLFWTGQSVTDVAIYAVDGRARALPLLAVGDPEPGESLYSARVPARWPVVPPRPPARLHRPQRRLALDPREVHDGAHLRRAADDVRADVQRRIGPELRQRDDERGRALRLDVDARAVAMARDDVRRDPDDHPVDGRVHVGTRRRADVDRRRRAAAEAVPDRVAAAAAEDAVEHALHEAFVPLVSDGRQRERTIARSVVADSRLPHLRDGHLQTHRAAQRDDLRERRRRRVRREIRHRETLQLLRGSAEGGQRQGDQQDDRQQGEEREPTGATR